MRGLGIFQTRNVTCESVTDWQREYMQYLVVWLMSLVRQTGGSSCRLKIEEVLVEVNFFICLFFFPFAKLWCLTVFIKRIGCRMYWKVNLGLKFWNCGCIFGAEIAWNCDLNVNVGCKIKLLRVFWLLWLSSWSSCRSSLLNKIWEEFHLVFRL